MLDFILNELHKPVAKITETRQVFTDGTDDIWSLDLVDMA
jgi:hypothetical protein